MVSLHFHIVEVDTAPGIPMPGDVAPVQEDRLNISYVNGEVFQASCRLWKIFAAIAKRYYHEGTVSDQTASAEFAEEVYRQLLDWADDLPIELVRRPGSCHGVQMLQ